MSNPPEHGRYFNGHQDGLSGSAAPGPAAARSVLIHIVSFNHEKTIASCLQAALETAAKLPADSAGLYSAKLKISDNRSTDQTAAIVERLLAQNKGPAAKGNQTRPIGNPAEDSDDLLVIHPQNMGFSAAHNLAFAAAVEDRFDYVLVLNPDLRLESGALTRLIRALENDQSAGSACPKLLRAAADLSLSDPRRFDSTGMYITPSLRHFDRGSNEIDRGQYDRPEYVFGASGACALFSRHFLLDIAISYKRADGRLTDLEVFDDDFFAYREDADLAWRAQRRGWRCRYVPEAVGLHVRSVLPANRSTTAPQINCWSVRNRFLMRWSNFSLISNLHCLPAVLWRDLLVIGAVLIRERSSLAGLGQALKLLPKSLEKRRIIFGRRNVPEARLARWFSEKPFAEPALVKKTAALNPTAAVIDSAEEGPVRSVSVIVINFNSGPHLAACIKAAYPAVKLLAPRLGISLLIFDNGSADGSLESGIEELPGVTVVRAGENCGFGPAINRAVELAPADAYLILNPDVEVGAESIALLAGALDRYETLGAISPRLLDRDGRLQRRYVARSFPTAASLAAELFFLHRFWPKNPWTAGYFLQGDQRIEAALDGPGADGESVPILVEQPAAACLMLRGSAFRSVGGFDSRFFPAWFEDVDLLNRLNRAGYTAAFHPAAEARHAGGYSKQVLSPAQFAAIWFRNLGRYIEKHFAGTERYALKALLRGGILLRSAAAAANWIISLGGFSGRSAGPGSEQKDLALVLLRLALFGTEAAALSAAVRPGSAVEAPLPAP